MALHGHSACAAIWSRCWRYFAQRRTFKHAGVFRHETTGHKLATQPQTRPVACGCHVCWRHRSHNAGPNHVRRCRRKPFRMLSGDNLSPERPRTGLEPVECRHNRLERRRRCETPPLLCIARLLVPCAHGRWRLRLGGQASPEACCLQLTSNPPHNRAWVVRAAPWVSRCRFVLAFRSPAVLGQGSKRG